MTSQHTRVCWLLVLAFLTVCVEGFAPGTAIRLRHASCAVVNINMGQKPPEARLQLPQAKLEAMTANKKQWGISDSATGVPAGADMPQARQFLLSIMSSRTSQAEKKKFIEISRQMRVNGEAEYLAFLETLLNEVDSVKNNKFAMTRWPIAIPSYRVKLGCLNRVLTQLLEEGMDENVRREGLRIRTLATLVRQLEVSKDVRALESDALNGKNEVTMADMLKRTPAGLETPAYKVLEEKGRWELRQYVDFSVCSFDMQASPERAGYGAFNALAGYIFGRNQEQVKMAMTTPVINHGASKKMSFVMPSTYWNENAPPAPTPMADSGVKLEGSGGGMISKSAQVAVVWFGGFASKELVSQKKALLKSLLESDPRWKAVDEGAEPLLLQARPTCFFPLLIQAPLKLS